MEGSLPTTSFISRNEWQNHRRLVILIVGHEILTILINRGYCTSTIGMDLFNWFSGRFSFPSDNPIGSFIPPTNLDIHIPARNLSNKRIKNILNKHLSATFQILLKQR
jgi:hypothetical protein